MDLIQQIMLLLRDLIVKLRKIFEFVNTEFLPETDDDDIYDDEYKYYLG